MTRFSDVFKLIDAIQDGSYDKIRENAGVELTDRLEVGRHYIFIDTCTSFPEEGFETGIERNRDGKVIIVEYYQDPENARQGHKKWVEALKTNPEMELPDAQGDITSW